MMIGQEGMRRLNRMHVLVVGLGGVGGYAAEMLCRSGVGHLTIVDGDKVSESNINRQLVALHSTVGQSKAKLFASRFTDINPDCKVTAIEEFLRDDRTVRLLADGHFDYVVDAIDTLSPKVFLLYHARQLGIPVISSMGSGGKTDPTKITISDIAESHTCRLAAAVRKRLHRMGVENGIKVVFSTEQVCNDAVAEEVGQNKLSVTGTMPYLPPIFGCCCASVVIRELANSNL